MSMFDVEQGILMCWEVGQDLKLLEESISYGDDIDNDEMQDKLAAIRNLYEMRFDNLWKAYEKALKGE